MGADFLVAVLPAFDVDNAGNMDALRRVVAAMPASELEFVRDSVGACDGDLEETRREVLEALDQLPNTARGREVTMLDGQCIKGAEYPVWITGGMSWGDLPTEAFGVFEVLSATTSVYRLIQELAAA